jgi:hypothetical protein
MSKQIYFAACGGRIKIGIAGNVMSRLKQVGNHLSEPIELIGAIPGDHELERIIHVRLRPYRLKGEWFRDCPETRHFIHDVLVRTPADAPSQPGGDIQSKKNEISNHPITFADLARLAYPVATARWLAERTGVDLRTAKRWLAGKSQAPAKAVYRALGDIFDRLD